MEDGDASVEGLPVGFEPKGITETFSFGVGCFHFRYRSEFINNHPIKIWALAVEAFLSKYTNVNNIEIGLGERSFFRRSDNVPMSDGVGIYPWPVNAKISFEIFIPKRIQKELQIINHINQERFFVYIEYGNNLPVAYVWSCDVYLSRPSDAVVVVRKYMERYAPKDPTDIVFEFIGPSPFHANFFVSASSENDVFDAEVVARPGYNDIKVSAPPFFCSGKNEYKKIVCGIIQDEVGHFYYVLQLKAVFMRRWTDIESDISFIAERAAKKQRYMNIYMLWKDRRRIDGCALSIAAFDIDWQRDKRDIELAVDQRKHCSGPNYLSEYIVEVVNEISGYPVEKTMKAIDIIERKNKNELQSAYIIAAAVLGMVGALLAGSWNAFLSSRLHVQAGAAISPVGCNPAAPSTRQTGSVSQPKQ